MERQAIIRFFLERGAQLDKDALDILSNNQELLQNILKIDAKSLPTVITPQILKSLFPHQALSTNDLSQILNYRYKKFERLLAGRNELENLVSINKMSGKLKRFSVIGMVFEINREIILEDPTGQASFKIADDLVKYIVEDEVIGAVCENSSDGNRILNVVYPDIPLKRDVAKAATGKKYTFLSDLHMDSPGFNVKYYNSLLSWLEAQKITDIFLLGGISDREKDIEKLVSDAPKQINIHRFAEPHLSLESDYLQLFAANGGFLRYYMSKWGAPTDVALVNLIKKRNLNPTITQENHDNSFMLESVPDIVVLWGADTPTITHYKGTTIIANGSFLSDPAYWAIDLETRETYKTDFS